MIKKCENHVAYGEIDENTAKKLFKKYVPKILNEAVIKDDYKLVYKKLLQLSNGYIVEQCFASVVRRFE